MFVVYVRTPHRLFSPRVLNMHHQEPLHGFAKCENWKQNALLILDRTGMKMYRKPKGFWDLTRLSD